jgi:subtilisin
MGSFIKTEILTRFLMTTPPLILRIFCIVGLSGLFSPLTAAEAQLKVLIGFKAKPGPSEHALVRSHGGSVTRSFNLVPAVAAQIPAAALDGLQRHPHVTVIEPDGQFHAVSTATELNNTWGIKHIGAGTLHALADPVVGKDIKVGILDSGINYNHPDLAANYAGGYDFVNSDNNPMDDNGHGTHVAGTVAAVRNGAGVVGAAPAAKLYALKVLNASGSGSFSSMIAALEWCVTQGIAIANHSYGAGQDPGTIVRQAYDNSAAAGILHIAAAGNSGTKSGGGNNVGWPARYDSVVAVAATDSNNNRASFSSTGPTVELSAPGVNINSTHIGGNYTAYNGTSMASPHVAGVAALLRSLSSTATVQELREVLQRSAQDLGAEGRDSLYGFGLVNVEAAVMELAKLQPSVEEPKPTSPPPSSEPNPEVIALSFHNVESVKTNTKNGSFEVRWTTNLPATSVLQFTAGGSGTFTETTLKTEHRMSFRGTKGATYTFVLSGAAADGTTADSGPWVHQN